ncbi:bacteriorhodopsin [Cryobacterium sp. CG_9.6]|uniref:bacteriorhodopsin n=1 Tax=Cryobacterium sp. CG_9.6 TaxID=2760710 RepID=UPI002475B0B2|nr:bacteriorhodopsin [Cryobacterium sp. CG_9.6]MDH6237083.1 bacteriorhodopsin [Cryobacterium sp. CG_9.6]
MNHMISAPWEASLTQSEHSLIFYFLGLTGSALAFGFVRTWISRGEVGVRYRTAVIARVGIMLVAVLSYILLITAFSIGYDKVGALWVPNSHAIMTMAPRYVEWSIAVPLLTIELLSVSALIGRRARRTEAAAVTGAFLMIFTGFLGAVVIGDGRSLESLLLWGAVSTVFWIITTAIVIRAIRQSLPQLTPEAAVLLRNATILLLSGWALYPVAYLIPVLFSGGAATTTMYILLCATDLVVKLGFSGLIHRVAKLRTAEDVRVGVDIHQEAIWISSIKQSDAGIPTVVYLPEVETIHQRRPKPADSNATATASAPSEEWAKDLTSTDL